MSESFYVNYFDFVIVVKLVLVKIQSNYAKIRINNSNELLIRIPQVVISSLWVNKAIKPIEANLKSIMKK
ncbi:hypothetical protein BpHYR1_002715 [Brachionus plicatilis]|uniref:Uncharacterized protein n=1 Tax=Brachionus plicatilis TaxID=10195 RepID=A0A3M7QHY7_BRAPC|nr:hypothetical protein BpHYR1_002715 [Brachionus plicatilis]